MKQMNLFSFDFFSLTLTQHNNTYLHIIIFYMKCNEAIIFYFQAVCHLFIYNLFFFFFYSFYYYFIIIIASDCVQKLYLFIVFFSK